MPLRLLAQLLNPATLKAIGGLVLVLAVASVLYNESVPPEHCVENTQEIRNALSAKGIEISSTDTGRNKVCFRSKDANLIREISEKSQDVFLELELKKIEGRQQWWDNYGIFVIGIIAVCVTIVLLSIILSRNRNPY